MTTGTHWASVDQRQDGAPGAYLPGIWKSDWAVGRGFGVESKEEQNRGGKKKKNKEIHKKNPLKILCQIYNK